jgi:HNH endonuclease
MSTKLIDRLLFTQGGLCFFCSKPMNPGDATVEHLVASANGGTNDPGNCVVCCKTLNALLGRMSIKEKIRIVLNQRGSFKCPNGNSRPPTSSLSPAPEALSIEDRVAVAITDLHKRGAAKPRTIKTLTSTIGALFRKSLSAEEVEEVLAALQTKGIITVTGTKVSYESPAAGA